VNNTFDENDNKMEVIEQDTRYRKIVITTIAIVALLDCCFRLFPSLCFILKELWIGKPSFDNYFLQSFIFNLSSILCLIGVIPAFYFSYKGKKNSLIIISLIFLILLALLQLHYCDFVAILILAGALVALYLSFGKKDGARKIIVPLLVPGLAMASIVIMFIVGGLLKFFPLLIFVVPVILIVLLIFMGTTQNVVTLKYYCWGYLLLAIPLLALVSFALCMGHAFNSSSTSPLAGIPVVATILLLPLLLVFAFKRNSHKNNL